jgi:hypothetical protein
MQPETVNIHGQNEPGHNCPGSGRGCVGQHKSFEEMSQSPGDVRWSQSETKKIAHLGLRVT